MLPEPIITVVVPAYNHEAYIAEALASLQVQTMAEFDVVVIDDGSRDGTAEIAESFAREDQRFRVVRQENAGSHGAINRGVVEARAQWIAILNSDDRFAPERLSRLRDEARAGAQFVVTAVRLIDGEGAEITDPGHWWAQTLRRFHRKAVELGPVDGLLYGNYTVSTSNFFFARELFDAVGPMRPLRYVLDWEWALRAALHAPAAVRYLADERLLDYRLHGGNAILRGALRGACEVNLMHHELLARYGAPPTLVAALFHNQRLLRKNWRAAGEATAERYVRAREADVAVLREQAATLEGFVRAREADVAVLREQAATLEGFVRAREADVAVLREQTATLEGFVRAREADLAELRSRLDEAVATNRWIDRLLPSRARGALNRLAARRKA